MAQSPSDSRFLQISPLPPHWINESCCLPCPSWSSCCSSFSPVLLGYPCFVLSSSSQEEPFCLVIRVLFSLDFDRRRRKKEKEKDRERERGERGERWEMREREREKCMYNILMFKGHRQHRDVHLAAFLAEEQENEENKVATTELWHSIHPDRAYSWIIIWLQRFTQSWVFLSSKFDALFCQEVLCSRHKIHLEMLLQTKEGVDNWALYLVRHGGPRSQFVLRAHLPWEFCAVISCFGVSKLSLKDLCNDELILIEVTKANHTTDMRTRTHAHTLLKCSFSPP